jgi:N-acetyl sugar amidotransferase
MTFKGKICSRGVWDESVPGIKFDTNGVSNYARLMDNLVNAYPRGEAGKKEWLRILDSIKKKGRGKRYDCIIGVSGGTDSCYLLHLAREQGLRPLAVNLDNGWSSDIAVKNIRKLTGALGIDLETYVVNYEEIKDLIRSYMYSGLPWIDIPADIAIKSVLYKIAERENIRYVLRGNDFRSEGSQPTEWTYGDGRQLKAIHRRFGRVSLKTFPNYTMTNLLYYGFINGIKSVYPYYYIDYYKNKARELLVERYEWEYYGGHHHENIFTKFVISYWLYVKYGIDKRKITLSAQVLNGEIERDEAIALIDQLPYDETTIIATLDYVLKKLDLSKEEFETIMMIPNRTYKDYPSYSAIFDTMSRIAVPVLKLIFIHKPQSLFQAEMRNKNH